MGSKPFDPAPDVEAASGVEREVWTALRSVQDPELPVSIVDLGLVYGVTVDGNAAEVEMTLTYSGCPARDMIVGDVEDAVESVASIQSVAVSIVHSPPWSVDMISDDGREALIDYGLAVPESNTSDPACDQ